ncbi:fungal-specific transcription factor domain-containing protein [Zalerion maritima]|uniref:Fungal-specific transcription factor domain-containing protein n=1 Tax=Zalerion maritima TaxID=339359 RepID=A0AAD5RK87_9PEZI|nr:fungal-specific transcription factor domain-containing protein [Zalerion maritima]
MASSFDSTSPDQNILAGISNMDAMDMESESMGGCKISMLWNWYTIDACFLTSSWHVKSGGAMAASCIGVMLLTVCLEGLRRLGKEYDGSISRQFNAKAAEDTKPVSSDSSTNGDSSGARTLVFRASPLQQLARAVIHAATFGVAYIIMLLAMYFNGYIIICIFIGAGIGKFVCDWLVVRVNVGGNSCAGGLNGQDTNEHAIDETTGDSEYSKVAVLVKSRWGADSVPRPEHRNHGAFASPRYMAVLLNKDASRRFQLLKDVPQDLQVMRPVQAKQIIQGDTAIRCKSCIKRGELCRFKEIKRRLRRPLQISTEPSIGNAVPHKQTHPSQDSPSVLPIGSERLATSLPIPSRLGENIAGAQPLTPPPRLFIDDIIDHQQESGALADGPYIVKHSPQVLVSSSSLAFWSERNIANISEQLGSSRLQELIEKIDDILSERVFNGPQILFQESKDEVVVSEPNARKYIQAYFNYIHPMYPFLDRDEFEQIAFSPALIKSSNPPFAALYYAVLALGCQYCAGGSFDPHRGHSWTIFQKALSLVPAILVPRDSLLTVQSIFNFNTCCLHIDEILLMEATRASIALWYHKSSLSGMGSRDQATCQRTFWVLYTMEKQQCLDCQRHSLFADEDIGSPIPWTPDAVFSGYNYFQSSIHFARISSVAYTSLFTISGALSSVPQYHASLDHVQALLHKWLLSVPQEFRPGRLRTSYNFSSPVARTVFLQTSYRYYSLVITLARLRLHLDEHDPHQEERRDECRIALVSASQAIIELTRYIDIDAYTPVFILGAMPMVALFILFDFVIHNPSHPETRQNILLLDVVSGHFSRIEYASEGSLPGSVLAEFSDIAKEYIQNHGKHPPQRASDKDDEIDSTTTLIPNEPFTTSNISWLESQNPAGDANQLEAIESLSYSSPAMQNMEVDDGLFSGVDFRFLFGHTFSNPTDILQPRTLAPAEKPSEPEKQPN